MDFPFVNHRNMAQVIADENSAYEVRSTSIKHPLKGWYVARTGKRQRLSVVFETPEDAERCKRVLIRDDAARDPQPA